MTAQAMLRDLADAGVRLTTDGRKLHVEAAPGIVTADLRRILMERKGELIEVLQQVSTPVRAPIRARGSADVVGIVEWWQERAAIMEMSDGLSRDEAERRAWLRTWARFRLSAGGELADAPRAAR